MLRRTLLALCVLSLVFAASCGSSFRHIQVRKTSEAEYLKAEVAAKNLQCDEVTLGDKFLSEAKKTKGQQSADLADLATAHYRVALARQSAEESAGTLKKAEAALALSKEQVERYQSILTHLNANTGGR